MGFGGSRWTKDYALKIIVYAMSVGAKLFVLQLLIGLGQQIFNQLIQNFQTNTSDLLVAVGSAIVMLALTKIIPDMIQALINGVSVSGNAAMVSSAVGIGTASTWGTVKGTVTTGMVGYRSSKLASEQMQDAQASGSWFKPGRGLRMAGNVALAAADTLGARLSGRMHHGTWGGQMAQSLKERAIDRQADRTAQQAAQPQGSVSPGGPAPKKP